MIQRFIELGNGFTDLYEFCEIIQRNEDRVTHVFEFESEIKGQTVLSYAVSLKPTVIGEFQPIYICREGITLKDQQSKRKTLIHDFSSQHSMKIIPIKVKHSSVFNTLDHFYSYLIALLRLNHLIPPLK